ncbi:MAG: SAM-dependent methyltransferase, partial [Polyangiaceae bacterium]
MKARTVAVLSLVMLSAAAVAACREPPPVPPQTPVDSSSLHLSPPTKAPEDAGNAPASIAGNNAALSSDAIKAIVSAPDRTEGDLKMDVHRHPEHLLVFTGVAPGMNVADLGSGGGYTTELLARAVGTSGKVYAQNDPALVKKFMEKSIVERLARPADKNVVRVDRPFDDPFPPEAKNLDLVTMVIFYHDTVHLGVNRDTMNRAVFDALKPGGMFVVLDASAKDGDGTNDAKTLHRIEPSVVKAEVEKA